MTAPSAVPHRASATRLIPAGERTSRMTKLSAFAETNLNRQGFGRLDHEAKSRYALPLRFTPAVGTTLIVIGLVLQSPIWLGSMALVAFSGAVLPRGMMIDLVYNLGVRHLFRSPPLPTTPRPRRFSYPSFHCPVGGFSRVLLVRTAGVRGYLGSDGRRRGHNPHHHALVSWIVVLQDPVRVCNEKLVIDRPNAFR